MIEKHPFPPFIPHNATKLVLGSFPCRKWGSYGEWYYSGSGKSDFWRLLERVFQMPANNLAEKKELCLHHGIALSDIAHTILRTKNNCSDSNLRILQYNQEQILSCLQPSIKKVLCTGRYVASKFQKMFPELEIPVFVLPSPSPAANRYIASLEDYRNSQLNIFDYKLEIYKRLLMDNP